MSDCSTVIRPEPNDNVKGKGRATRVGNPKLLNPRPRSRMFALDKNLKSIADRDFGHAVIAARSATALHRVSFPVADEPGTAALRYTAAAPPEFEVAVKLAPLIYAGVTLAFLGR